MHENAVLSSLFYSNLSGLRCFLIKMELSGERDPRAGKRRGKIRAETTAESELTETPEI